MSLLHSWLSGEGLGWLPHANSMVEAQLPTRDRGGTAPMISNLSKHVTELASTLNWRLGWVGGNGNFANLRSSFLCFQVGPFSSGKYMDFVLLKGWKRARAEEGSEHPTSANKQCLSRGVFNKHFSSCCSWATAFLWEDKVCLSTLSMRIILTRRCSKIKEPAALVPEACGWIQSINLIDYCNVTSLQVSPLPPLSPAKSYWIYPELWSAGLTCPCLYSAAGLNPSRSEKNVVYSQTMLLLALHLAYLKGMASSRAVARSVARAAGMLCITYSFSFPYHEEWQPHYGGVQETILWKDGPWY